MKRKAVFTWSFILLVIVSIVSICVATGLGSVNVSIGQVGKIISNHLFNSDYLVPIAQNRIIWELRLPRVLLGFIVGGALAVTGVIMQALVRNEMADPFVLGISSGASVMATLCMIFGVFTGFGIYSTAISAFIGAILTTMVVYALSRYQNKIIITQLLLSGLVISMILDGVTKIITLSAPNALGLHNAEFWMSGSLAGAKWEYLTLPTVIMVIALVFLLFNGRALNVLLLGEEAAQTTGINVRVFQKTLMVISSVLVAAAISVSGVIGFVGLICPHLARLIVGSDHRKVLPISLLLGGLLVVWTDVLARMLVAPEELPLGTLTAIIGGPIFILLLKRKRTH